MSSLSYFHETVLFAVARSFTITVDKYDLTINVLCVCVCGFAFVHMLSELISVLMH